MIIEVKDLWKSYGKGEAKVDALKGINLNIKQGEFASLLGPSGSGKSTLLHILGAMDKPTMGQVFVNGTDIGTLSDSKLNNIRLKGIGFIFQTFNLVSTLTALENVMLPMKLNGIRGKKAKEKALELLELVELKNRASHYPKEMSGGQKQRVAIARAIANEPSLILADEPTGNLDSENGERVMEMLLKLNAKGHTIVMVTHNEELAKRTSRTLFMKDGRFI